jgi:hypothetical protein
MLCAVLAKPASASVSSTYSLNIYFASGSLPQLETGATRLTVLEWAVSQSSLKPASLEDCLTSRNSQLAVYIDPSSGISASCADSYNLLYGVFQQKFPYVYFEVSIGPTVAPLRYASPLQDTPLKLTYFLGSNSTYQSDTTAIVGDNLNQLRHSAFLLVGLLLLTLLLLSITVDTIETTLITSIVLVRSLYDNLKNKEEKEFNALAQKSELFGFIGDYFRKFMWIHKLLKFKSKARYKRLLCEGIEMFGQDNPAVQEYIFRELIQIEGCLVGKYLKSKELPSKRKSTAKSNFRFTNTKLNTMVEKEKATSKRRHAHLHLLDPDDEQLMKNISISFRGNRGVRFSNDIQTLEIDEGPVLRKAKFSEISGQTCKTIQNQLEEENLDSVHLTENKDSIKSLKEDDDSYTSLGDLTRSRKKESSLRSRGFESVHFDLNNLRLDEEFSDEEDDMVKEATEEEEIYQMGQAAITDETAQTYHRIISFYEELIALKTKATRHHDEDCLAEDVSAIYELTLQKYSWWAELLAFENDMSLIKSEEEREALAAFEDLEGLEQRYMHFLRHELLQRG